MTEKSPYNWPIPYLLQIYEKAVAEGCMRVRLHGDEKKFTSLRAAFHRIRRRSDKRHATLIRAEYEACSMVWEPDTGCALVIYSALPDGQELPEFESVDEKRSITPATAIAPVVEDPTELDEPDEEFDSQAHVAGLLSNLNFEDDDDATDLE